MMAWYYSDDADDADDAADVNEKPFSYAHILQGLTGLRVNMVCWILEGEKIMLSLSNNVQRKHKYFFFGKLGLFSVALSRSLTHSFQIIALLIK